MPCSFFLPSNLSSVPKFSQTLLKSTDKESGISLLVIQNSAAATAKSFQSCLTLCDPIDGSPPGSPIAGILQTRTLEWVAISFFNAWKWKVNVKSLSHVPPSVTPWTAAFQAPPSMGFSRQEYWSGVPLPSPKCPSVQFSRSVVYHSATPAVHHQLPEFTQTHVHWVGDANQPSHPLSSPTPPAPNPS